MSLSHCPLEEAETSAGNFFGSFKCAAFLQEKGKKRGKRKRVEAGRNEGARTCVVSSGLTVGLRLWLVQGEPSRKGRSALRLEQKKARYLDQRSPFLHRPALSRLSQDTLKTRSCFLQRFRPCFLASVASILLKKDCASVRSVGVSKAGVRPRLRKNLRLRLPLRLPLRLRLPPAGLGLESNLLPPPLPEKTRTMGPLMPGKM